MGRLTLIDALSVIKDPRVKRTRKHELVDIIVIAVCGVLAGCQSWVEIVEFAEDRKDWFKKFLNLEGGIASHDTFGRVFSLLDPEVFQKIFFEWLRSTIELAHPKSVHIDGKFLRGSLQESGNLVSSLQIVSAWSSDLGVCLGIKKSALKKDVSEKQMMESLINELYLKGCLVTLDAGGATEQIIECIVKKEADYLVGLKKNQKTILRYAQKAFELLPPDQSYQSVDKGHGRIEIRQYELLNVNRERLSSMERTWDIKAQKFKNLSCVVRVTSSREVQGKVTEEVRYYFTSVNEVRMAARAIRDHWSVENQLHHTLDVVFKEDHSQVRIGHAAENLALIRRITLNLLKKEITKKKSLRVKQNACMANPSYMEVVLGLKNEPAVNQI